MKRIMALALLFSLLIPISLANADSSGPRIQVTQATRTDGSVNVQLIGSGFTPGTVIYLYGGCTANPSNISSCASMAFEGREINASGSFQTTITENYPMWAEGLCDSSSGKVCGLVATPTYGSLGNGWVSTNFSFTQSPPPTTTTTSPPPTTTTTLVRYSFTTKQLNSCVSTLNSWVSWFNPGGLGSPKMGVVDSMLDFYWNTIIARTSLTDFYNTMDLRDWVNWKTVGLPTYSMTATVECTGVLALTGKVLPSPPNNSSFQSGWNWVATRKPVYGGNYPWVTWTTDMGFDQRTCQAITKYSGFHKFASVSQWISGCGWAVRLLVEGGQPEKY